MSSQPKGYKKDERSNNSNSNVPKLYPLFLPRMALMNETIDNGDMRDDEDEDDVPLSSLAVGYGVSGAKRTNTTASSTTTTTKRKDSTGQSSKTHYKRPQHASLNDAGTNKIKNNHVKENFENGRKKQKKVHPLLFDGHASSRHQLKRSSTNMPRTSTAEAQYSSQHDNPVNGTDHVYNSENLDRENIQESANISPWKRENEFNDIQNDRPRIFSNSAMDIDIQNVQHIKGTPSSTSCEINIVDRLIRRSTTGRSLSSKSNYSSHPNKCLWPKQWSIPSWVSLEKPTIYSPSGITKDIDHMAWDTLGVLLAVVIDKTVCIYDWDMIRAADIQGRRDRSRRLNDSEWKIEPIVQFQLHYPVSCLVWNPYNIDELAIGFRASGQIRIYNVDSVAQWVCEVPVHCRRIPPKKTFRLIANPSRMNGPVNDILFVDLDNILVSLGSMVYRWKLPKQKGSTSSVVWRYKPLSPVTSMEPFGSNLVLLGTIQGQLCLVDWTIFTKERSFSNEYRPNVFRVFTPHEQLVAVREDNNLRKKMGIVKMKVETAGSANCRLGDGLWGRCRLTWVTQSGWLLSTEFESLEVKISTCKVHHSTSRIIYRNADGGLITTDKKSWSLPSARLGVDFSGGAVCFSDVPGATHVLSHHDKFVLDSRPSIIQSKKRTLMVHTKHDKCVIALPAGIKGHTQIIALHPSLDWIVVAEGKSLHLLTGRECIRLERE